MQVLKSYDVHLDSKKRITLRGAMYEYYNVVEYDNGCIMLEPRELSVPENVSQKMLGAIQQALKLYMAEEMNKPLEPEE